MEPLFIERSIYGEGDGLECRNNVADFDRRKSDSDEELGDIGTGLDAVEGITITEGQVFPSYEVAFEHYVQYAKTHGFAVRKQRTFNRDWGDKGVYRKDFVCFKACNDEKKANAIEDSVHHNKESTHDDMIDVSNNSVTEALGDLVNGYNDYENPQCSL
ncbi:hypothetical protein NE237_016607 [Protea cynaroides]|uniref:FAR1 domain-containing protein n=1 Tax=Protea cynaroides TaxID=273540 RepID=A0A9Q0K728_9MAGN|nr:hypothetical protein NE237_016607 [Protea cynaroides]